MKQTASSWEGIHSPAAVQQDMRNTESSQQIRRPRNPLLKPHPLLDFILERLDLPNDAALCRRLEVKPYYISKIRNRRERVSSELLIALHDETGISIRELKSHLE